MKPIIPFILSVFLLLLISCNKEKLYGGPHQYQDSFESYHTLNDLLKTDESSWSFSQNTVGGNLVAPDSGFSHTGKRSMKFSAAASGDIVSKASISKQHMAFKQGNVVEFSGWYFIPSSQPTDWLFIFDLEENTAIGAGPGMRLALTTDSGCLTVEHKYLETDLYQKHPRAFPRDQWVHVVFQSFLSQKKDGWVKVFQNDELIIDATNTKTLPRDFLYNLQGTKGWYSSIETGITANTKLGKTTLFVDDIAVRILE